MFEYITFNGRKNMVSLYRKIWLVYTENMVSLYRKIWLVYTENMVSLYRKYG